MRRARVVLVWLGAVAIVAALTSLLIPLHASGVKGNALRPHYVEFGWEAYAPLPAHPSHEDLKAAGVPFPQDAVNRRREEAAAVAAVAAGLLAVGLLAIRKRRPTDRAPVATS